MGTVFQAEARCKDLRTSTWWKFRLEFSTEFYLAARRSEWSKYCLWSRYSMTMTTAPKYVTWNLIHSHFIFDWLLTDFSVDLLISMQQIYTNEDVKQLSVGQRKCVFPGELKLDYSDGDYTFTSCMKECRLENCLKYCDCIPPFYTPIRMFSSSFVFIHFEIQIFTTLSIIQERWIIVNRRI